MYREGARRGAGLHFPLNHVVNDDIGGAMLGVLTLILQHLVYLRFKGKEGILSTMGGITPLNGMTSLLPRIRNTPERWR